MDKVLFSPIQLNELEILIQNSVRKALTESVKNQTGMQPEADQLLNMREAAAFLNLKPYTIYGMVSRGEIPVNKKGKKLMFLRSELLDWVKSGRRKTSSEIEAEATSYLKPKSRRSHE